MSVKSISKLEVRDYECDMQGIVNNANYFHYLEHSRHQFLNSLNFDFKKLHDDGFDLVVSNMEVKFIKPLRPRDCFEIRLKVSKEGRLRYIFDQEIWKAEVLMLKAKVTVACVDLKRGRPCIFKPLDQYLSLETQ